MSYKPEQFINCYNRHSGKDIWDFLNEPEMITRLKTASDLRKPAVESIEQQFINRFKRKIENIGHEKNRLKQMVGHMIRQVLEPQGYKHEKYSVKVSRSKFFTTGSRYKLEKE